MASNIFSVESRVLKVVYVPFDSKNETSTLMQQRNCKTLTESLGGVQVWAGTLPHEVVNKFGSDEYDTHSAGMELGKAVATYVIRRPGQQMWLEVVPDEYGPTCGRIKKLTTEGHVALCLNSDADTASLRPDAQPVLAEALKLLQTSPGLAIQGHTDNQGTPSHNLGVE